MPSLQLSSVESFPEVALRRAAGEAIAVPGAYAEYVFALHSLLPPEWLSWCREQVLDRRAGAYEFVDLALFLLAFFTSADRTASLSEFAAQSRTYGPELAGVAGRARWLSQPSLSRALAAVGPALATEASERMLSATSAFSLESPLARNSGYLDGLGEPWWVLHWDTTVTTFRERALPEDDTLPAAIRLTTGFAATGYAGRKRGEVQISRSVLQDACSSAWLHVDVQPGNGSRAEQFDAVATAAVRYLREDPARMEFAVVVADGVGGGSQQATRVRQAGVHVLTRWAQYSVLEAPECRALLATEGWMDVEDSRSGPRRQARELGTTMLWDNAEYRVLVSRYRMAPGRPRGVGHALDGWRYELFLTTLPASRWAAPDLVQLYYGRTAIENRFAAEDREFGLDRVFSYSRPGQQLACAIALSIWNLRVAGGFAAVPEHVTRKPMRDRPEVAVAPLVGAASGDDAPELDLVEPTAESKDATPLASLSSPPQDPLPGALTKWCAAHPSWRVDPDGYGLRCPQDKLLTLSGLRPGAADTVLARYRPSHGVCPTCPNRDSCSPRSTAEKFRREVTVTIPSVDVSGADHSRPGSTPAVRLQRLLLSVEPMTLPQYLPATTVLLPAPLRRKTRELISQATLHVWLPPKPEDTPDEVPDDHVAEDDADRQGRRLTIAERIAINAHPDPEAVLISAQAPPDFGAWLERAISLSRSG